MFQSSKGEEWRQISGKYAHRYGFVSLFFLHSFVQWTAYFKILSIKNKTRREKNNNQRKAGGYRSWLTSYFSVFAFFCHAGHNLVLRELMHLPFRCWQAVFQQNMEFYLFIYLRSPEDCTQETPRVLPITHRYQHMYIFWLHYDWWCLFVAGCLNLSFSFALYLSPLLGLFCVWWFFFK